MRRKKSFLASVEASIESLEPRRLLSDVYESNNSLAAATDFGSLGDREEVDTLDISPSGDQDFFRITAAGNGNVLIRISFVSFFGDLDLHLYGPTNALVATSDGNGNTEEINYTVSAGQTYTINVAGFQGATNPYDLLIDGPDSGGGAGDRFEPNDNFAGATDLGTLGDRTENDLSIHQANNDDYFRFTAGANGNVTIGTTFTNSSGDLDLELYDGSQLLLTSSDGSGNSESITQTLTSGQQYYVRVFGFSGATNPQYNLTIDGPGGAPPAPTAAPDLVASSDAGQFSSDNITNVTMPGFQGSGALPGATIHLFSDATVEIGSGLVASDGAWAISASTTLSDGAHVITARQSNASGTSIDSPSLNVSIDTVRPAVVSPAFDYLQSPQAASGAYSEEVAWSLSETDFLLTNRSTSTVVSLIAHTFVAGRSRITVPGSPILLDANYQLRFKKDGVIDVAGNSMLANIDFDFFALSADANHDRHVDTADFTILATHFNQSGPTFSQGDFNYDGKVNALDFNALAAKFGTYLAPPASSAQTSLASAASVGHSSASLFGNVGIEDKDVAGIVA